MSLSNSAELPEGALDPVFFSPVINTRWPAPPLLVYTSLLNIPCLLPYAPAPLHQAAQPEQPSCSFARGAYLCCINHSFIAYPPSPFSGRHVFFFPGWCRWCTAGLYCSSSVKRWRIGASWPGVRHSAQHSCPARVHFIAATFIATVRRKQAWPKQLPYSFMPSFACLVSRNIEDVRVSLAVMFNHEAR